MAFHASFGGAVLGVVVLLGTSGCEIAACKNDAGESAVCATSLTRFEGDAVEPEAIAYVPGRNVAVHSIYGDIRVREGVAGEVRATFEPFNYRAHDAEADARRELSDSFDYSLADIEAAITAQTGRHDSKNGLGADITLYLPPEFDGRLGMTIHSDGPVNPGNIEAEFVGAASSLDLVTMKLGDCTVNGAASVGYTRANCDGHIALTGVANGGEISAKGLDGSVTLVLAELGASAGGNIHTEDGDITIQFPEGAAFDVSALATEDGKVLAPALEETCNPSIRAENSKSFTCGDEPGGGAHFSLIAGTDGVGPSNISLGF